MPTPSESCRNHIKLDNQLLAEFGVKPEDLVEVQELINVRNSVKKKAAKKGDVLSLAESIPRSKRRKIIPDEFLPKVAIVGESLILNPSISLPLTGHPLFQSGRPNVGKSAMFNRIAGTSIAVVYDEPGVTRDRLYTRAFWGDIDFVLIDTGGLMSDATRIAPDVQALAMKDISAAGLPLAIERQAAAGVSEADAVVLLVDGQEGLQPGDAEILSWLRQKHPSKVSKSNRLVGVRCG